MTTKLDASMVKNLPSGGGVSFRQVFKSGTDYPVGSTQLTLSQSPSSSDSVLVFFDAFMQQSTEYSVAGSTITFNEVIPSQIEQVEVIYSTMSVSDNENASVTRYGAIGDGTTLNDSFFSQAELENDVIYVPQGTFRLSSTILLDGAKYYWGPGVLKFDKAEWWRRGGSAGGAATERYTLFYEFENQSDVHVTFDDIEQTIISWPLPYTFEVNAPAAGVQVKIWAVNGLYRLGPVPSSPRSFNMFTSNGHKVTFNHPDPSVTPRPYDNINFGSQAGIALTTGNGNIAIGPRALRSNQNGDSNIMIGGQGLYRAVSPQRNTLIGVVSGELATTAIDNTSVGFVSLGKMYNGTGCTAVGSYALGESGDTNFATALGHRALGNGGETDNYGSIAIGAFAADFNQAPYNIAVGYRALNGENGAVTGSLNVILGHNSMRGASSGSKNVTVGHDSFRLATTATENVAIGFEAIHDNVGTNELVGVGSQSLRSNTTGPRNTGVGYSTLKANQVGGDNTAIGWNALVASTGNGNTAVGSRSQENNSSGINNSTVGFESGRFITTASGCTLFGFRSGRQLTTGNDNVAIGQDSLQFETTGVQNTALGRGALRVFQDGQNHVAVSNTTGVGYGASVSGANQVQLGNSATTTYVYGTVQNRSDIRDKADVRDTTLGLKFINMLRPVDYRWDMREDYTKAEERDGSKKRTRFHHGLIAQEVKETSDQLGVDFGGFQDHSINGGCDVQSLGYDEFIAPLIKSVQELAAMVNELKQEVASLKGE